MDFSTILHSWYNENQRDLPWRKTCDPYRIWLSEVILQQTRVAQGLDYYNRFIEAYPTVRDLADATEDEVLKLWQGLGYYSRARNLHKAARKVMSGASDGENRNPFPNSYSKLIKLPGIGPYTAAAIASFSSNEAVAVVDGNVYRVLSRLFDLDTPIDSPKGQKEFQELATELLDTQQPGLHNQAIMEFGALYCTPTSPKCENCPLLEGCLAWANHTVGVRPVKAGKVKVHERNLNYILYKYQNYLWVHQRGPGDIWQGLWEFYCSTEAPTSPSIYRLRHQLTHQLLNISFSVIELQQPITTLPDDYVRITWQEWQEKAVPKPILEANRHFSVLFE